MKVLVIGGGGREHTIVWKLAQDKRITNIYCAPGNGGIAQLATCVEIAATDIDKMVAYAKEQQFDLVVVAPDDPLALGMVDRLQAEGIRVFGPSKAAAQIEASKVFSKDLMRKYNIPTAAYEVFSDYNAALAYIRQAKLPIVVKADGLALGKGVLICNTLIEAEDALEDIMVKKIFKAAGERVVVEEFITGPEVSVLAFCDGKTIRPMVSAQDHKRIFDGDQGPNTGGMGTFAPTPKYTPQIRKYVEDQIMRPTVDAMAAEGRLFQGVLYFGLMLTAEGPKVLEYNARFGDPETQVVLPLLKTPLLDIFNAVIDGDLDKLDIVWSDETCVCVAAASGGYPGGYEKGKEISGLDTLDSDIMLFHAGTCCKDSKYYTNGGRVLGVTAKGCDMHEARQKAYTNIARISFEGMQYRKDIGIKK
jgi:phosphoribosylamine--glycine ligase